jgi:hypothetical protein
MRSTGRNPMPPSVPVPPALVPHHGDCEFAPKISKIKGNTTHKLIQIKLKNLLDLHKVIIIIIAIDS